MKAQWHYVSCFKVTGTSSLRVMACFLHAMQCLLVMALVY